MENFSNSIITNVLDSLLIALRYIASGFVAMAVYAYLYMPNFLKIKDFGGSLILVAATIGIITYGLHFATLDKVFNGWSIKKFIKKNNGYLPDVLIKQIYSWDLAKGTSGFISVNENKVELISELLQNFSSHEIKRKILFALSNQSYLRSLSNHLFLVKMQNQLEKRLALLNFLYCSFYQLFILGLYYLITNIAFNKMNEETSLKTIIILLVAIIFIYSARRFNNRICEREMWLAENYGQNVEDLIGMVNEEEKNILSYIIKFFKRENQ